MREIWLVYGRIFELVFNIILLVFSILSKYVVRRHRLFHSNVRLIGYFAQFGWFIQLFGRISGVIYLLIDQPIAEGKRFIIYDRAIIETQIFKCEQFPIKQNKKTKVQNCLRVYL